MGSGWEKGGTLTQKLTYRSGSYFYLKSKQNLLSNDIIYYLYHNGQRGSFWGEGKEYNWPEKKHLSQVPIAISNHHNLYFQMMWYMSIFRKPYFSPIFEVYEDLGQGRKGGFPKFWGESLNYIFLHFLSHKKSVEKTNGSLHGHGTIIFDPKIQLFN